MVKIPNLANNKIGKNTQIGKKNRENTQIGKKNKIGKNTKLAKTKIGKNTQIGNKRKWVKIPNWQKKNW